MGSRVSSEVGCLIPNRCSKHGDSAAAALGIHYYDPPPDEGLGHSYYVRPANFGLDSNTPLEFSFESVAWQSLMELLQLGLGEQQQQLQLCKLIKAAALGEVKYLGSSSIRDQQQ